MEGGFTKTKIVATVGPASESFEQLEALIDVGVDVFRLNMGHMDHDQVSEVISRIRRISSRVAILIDLQGPKIRLTAMDPPLEASAGDTIRLALGDAPSTREVLHIPFEDLFEAIDVDQRIFIDDGLVRLRMIERIDDQQIVARFDNDCVVKGKKGVVLPDTRMTPKTYLDEHDREDCALAVKRQVDFVAASFVSHAADVKAVRAALGDAGKDIHIISKIESRTGLENFDMILAASDGVMIARGDLGVELPPEEVPLIQKRLIKQCNSVAKPVVVATQMLESMVKNPVASRAETSDVANAILDGTDAVMLSAETSVGEYPVRVVKTLERISRYVEKEVSLLRTELFKRASSTRTEFVCRAAARAAEELHLGAILCVTSSGFTARNMSAYRPRVQIIATTPSDRVIRHMSLQYGVYCIHAEHIGRYDVMVYNSLRRAMDEGLIDETDMIAVMGGIPVGKSGSTNTLQVGPLLEFMELD